MDDLWMIYGGLNFQHPLVLNLPKRTFFIWEIHQRIEDFPVIIPSQTLNNLKILGSAQAPGTILG